MFSLYNGDGNKNSRCNNERERERERERYQLLKAVINVCTDKCIVIIVMIKLIFMQEKLLS